MNKEKAQKVLWRNRWLSSINELTSYELQKKSWLDKTNTNPHWSFVEFMCSYFDDLAIDNDYETPIRAEWISKNEYEVIKIWHKKLNSYKSPKNNDYDVEAILNDKLWQAIVTEGQITKNLLSQIIDKDEVKTLNENIDYQVINDRSKTKA